MFGVLRDAKGKDNLLMKDIAIFGAGGFGREVACLIRSINECIDVDEERWNFIGFFDDVKEKRIQNGIWRGHRWNQCAERMEEPPCTCYCHRFARSNKSYFWEC